LMLQEKRLHQIESDIIENQEELNKLKQLQFSTLSQLGSSKLDTKLHTMESQFDELNGVRKIIMLNVFKLIRQISQENKELKLQVTETMEDILFYKQRVSGELI
jgi:hypothetical protein